MSKYQDRLGRWIKEHPEDAVLANPPDVPEGRQDMAETQAVMTVTMEQLQALVTGAVEAATRQRMHDAATDGEQFAKQLAEAHRQAIRPENPQAPGISVYNPRGERDHPKPALACKTFQNGIQLEVENLDPEEIDLLNRVQTGDFYTTKTDGTKLPVLVRVIRDDNGLPQQKHVSWRAKEHDDLIGLTSLKSILRDVLGEKPATEEAIILRERMHALEAKLAAAGVPA